MMKKKTMRNDTNVSQIVDSQNHAQTSCRTMTSRSWMNTLTYGASACLIAMGLAVATSCSEEPQIGPLSGDGYMVSFEEAQVLDYSVAWQSSVARTLLGETTQIIPGDDYIITTESGNINTVCAITSRDGKPAWAEPVGGHLENLLGAIRFGNQVIATTQSDLYILDIASGREVSHQRFSAEAISSTVPVLFGSDALYGTADGRVILHSLPARLLRSSYSIGDGIEMAPLKAGPGAALVITRTGRLNLFDPVTNTIFWETGVLDPIEATPAISDSGVFVAGMDQSIWAFRLADGRQMWRKRFQHALIDSPVLIDDVLYQAVPNEGLVALDAATGKVIWQNSDIAGGTIITRNRTDLIVWDKHDGHDAYGSTFYRVDQFSGDLLGQIDTDWISLAAATSIDRGDIYGLSRAGRIIKLIP